jgi:CheY-like chemotaxis protein
MPPSRRILIVDDLRDAAESLAHLLQSMGYETQYVTEPTKALDAARRMHPDLVLLGLGMPEIDGYTLGRMLRAEFGFEKLRLVALTAWGESEHRAATRQAGFDAHVVKPADTHVIESILATVFGTRRP